MDYSKLLQQAFGGSEWNMLNQNYPDFFGYNRGYVQTKQPYDFRLADGSDPTQAKKFDYKQQYGLGEGIVPQLDFMPKVFPEAYKVPENLNETAPFPALQASGYPMPDNAQEGGSLGAQPPVARGEPGPIPMGLLAAGLGILANNTGHYGAAGPAIGKGGLVGLQAYGQERDRISQQSQLQQQNRIRDEQLKIQRDQSALQGRKLQRDENKDAEMTRLRGMLKMATTPQAKQAVIEEMIAVSGDPDALLKQFSPMKGERPFFEDIGVPGNPKLRQKALVSPDGTIIRVGEPFEMGKGVEVNVSSKGDNSFDEALNKKAADAVVTAAEQAKAAASTIQTTNKILEALDSGKVLAGPGTPVATTLLQLGRVIGVGGKDADEVLTNTRNAMQGLAQLELDSAQQMKGQGQITEAERAIIARAAAGKINELTTPELRTLLVLLQRTARWKISASNKTMEGLKGRGPAADVLTVPEPPQYTPPADPEREDKPGPWTRY